MQIKEMQDEILKLKKEQDCFILAHSYVATEICEIADVCGDSFALSVAASKVPNKKVIMCGVHFMAETAKLLSPDKTVILANPVSGCPMAEQFEPELVEDFKKKNPDYLVVSYINTTAALKCVTDVCVTSSSALKIVSQLENDKILFIPDINLGSYIQSQLPDKKLTMWHGGCPVHARMTKQTVLNAKAQHPNALLLVHPECQPEVCELADYVGATSGIMNFARKADCDEFIIGTEISIAELLSYEMPDKKFYPLAKELICQNMKAVTLVDVYNALRGKGGLEIAMDDETMKKARVCIDEMIRLG